MWEYEINNKVTSGVTSDGIKRLIGNGTLSSRSHIQQIGSDNWTTIEQSEFGSLLPAVQASKVSALPSSVQPVGERMLAYCSVGFAALVFIGFLIDLAGSRATSLGDAIVQNTSILHDIDVLLVCVVASVFISARAVVGQLRSHAEYTRAAEVTKLQELQMIRRALEQQSVTRVP